MQMFIFVVQNCLRVRDLLKSGAFGNCPEEAITDYEQRCRELFPLATALKLPAPPEPAGGGGGDNSNSEGQADTSASSDKPPPANQES